MVFYNENDPKAAAWLRELIAGGHIANGIVDQRGITEIQPGELHGFTQCHFFAGIGGWSLALRIARWADARAIWTASIPCQPLSSAGQHKGHADGRHLWPAFFRLVAERLPSGIFGEQVASKDGREWFAGVRADLEGIGYACGASDLCAACVGAPHIRQRIFWGAFRRMDNANFHGSAAGLSGSLTRKKGHAGIADNSGDEICPPPAESYGDIYGWSTPSSRDWKDTPGMARSGMNPDGSHRSRLDQLPRQAALAIGAPANSSNAPMEKRGALNPAHSRWLMGFPAAWDYCGATAMQSCRSSRRNSSTPLKTPLGN